MKSISAAERESTGALVTSTFHQFDIGKTWRPTSGSLSTGGGPHGPLTIAQTSRECDERRTHGHDQSTITYRAGREDAANALMDSAVAGNTG